MISKHSPMTVLMAEDDGDDRFLAQEAVREAKINLQLLFVEDGEELLDYLNRRGKYTALGDAPRPDLILLDLNMPRKDGREALAEIKSSPQLRSIPVVVLTTSQAQEDIDRVYAVSGSGYITKPGSFDELVEVMRSLRTYWMDTVELPG